MKSPGERERERGSQRKNHNREDLLGNWTIWRRLKKKWTGVAQKRRRNRKTLLLNTSIDRVIQTEKDTVKGKLEG